MSRFHVIALFGTVVLAACGGGGSGASLGVQGPPSAQSIAQDSKDFPGLQKCPESGSYDSYLKAEETKNPDQFKTDQTTWADLKASGANDSYIAVYAASASDCGQFASGTPAGKVAYVYAIRFKDTTSAAASYKVTSKDFHLSESDLASLTAAGGTVQIGTATGLGDNSTVLSLDIGGLAVYVAFWESKSFEVAMIAFNDAADAPGAVTKINARIR